MKKILFSLLFIPSICLASNISQPPVLKDRQIREYLKNIADNFNNIEWVTTNPDGSRLGKRGDVVILETGGNYYVEFCVSSPSGTTWRGIALSDTP